MTEGSDGHTAAYTVSVKALCAFGAKAGDLDLRFVPAPSAQEGIAGHSLVQSRRDDDYQSEVSLATVVGDLRVRGRADGYHPKHRRIEEIKTFRGDFDRIKANHRALHWAQARSYGWMLCEQHALPSITVALVYLDLDSGEETVLEERCTADALREAFQALCGRFAAWARQESLHRATLAASFDALVFPHAGFRPGQRELAEGVFRATAARRCLVAQAPTGIGKTIATLFPLFKGWTARRTDKVFFLTAKTSGRGVALESLRVLGRGCRSLRVTELVAREKVCEYPGRACHGDACPLAKGFYDRLPAAREEAATRAWLDRQALRELAEAHAVCPYFLAQEMVRWSDVVVADYNYWFDGSAFLYALTRDEVWRVSVLVDEAHNLLERARGMYSTELTESALDTARRVAPAGIRRVISQLHREWRAVQAPQTVAYVAGNTVPEPFQRALQDAVAVMAEHFAQTPEAASGPLQQFFFDVLQFSRLADSFGSHSVFESHVGVEGADTLAIRNLIPANFLRPRFEASIGTVCFSGTIAPFKFYRDALGLPDDTLSLEVDSPFRAQQLSVQVAMDVSTRWRDRAGSLESLVNIIATQFAARPGNYLAFFSSFEHLDAAREALARRHPAVPVWTQSRGMREAERDAFIARFAAEGQGIGFAVLGGAFGEGIDLPGKRLIGAFVASLGMPQHNDMNEVMRERMDEKFGEGYAYTYLYPGLRKVVQAAGRVIRTESDDGVLHLLDDRFARPEVRRLLPPWWNVELVGAA
ncbi:MAG: ATP-dependent DNA helicase [Variovorax sp.]|nr:MAG: ATP-dependent DNA helicase [Variovorax sp.]